MEGINERLRNVAGWSKEDPQYLSLKDNNRVFMECLLDQVKKEKDTEGLEHRSWAEAMAPSRMNVTHCSRSAWLHMWARLCLGYVVAIFLVPDLIAIFSDLLASMIFPSGFSCCPGPYSISSWPERDQTSSQSPHWGTSMKDSPDSVGKSWKKSLKMDTKMHLRYTLQFLFKGKLILLILRVEIMIWILRVTSSFSPTFSWARPFMDQVC